MEALEHKERISSFSCELEDWFHILDSDSVPPIEEWSQLPLRAERGVEQLLELFDETHTQATFFCLGWMAEQMPHVVRRCHEAGHEIGSHGYGHVLAYQVGRQGFLDDIVRSKRVLEDLIDEEVVGFRAPGFSVKDDNRWLFDVVSEAGYRYDASIFPAHHGHGGLCHAEPGPHVIETESGSLVEIPASTVQFLGRRICLFGGGHLRAAPLPLIRLGIRRLHREGRPLIVYIHPREVDPNHPRLPLPLKRRFKCYVNLSTTFPKLKWLCENHTFITMRAVAAQLEPAIERKPARPEVARAQPVAAIGEPRSRKRPAVQEQIHSS